MFFPPPDEKESPKTVVSSRSSRKKRKRKFPAKKNFKKEIYKKRNKFALMMSSWAEHFTVAATWQLKHQLAYWKAKAKSLEYENQFLHDVIRRNCTEDVSRTCDIHNVHQDNDSETIDSDTDEESSEENHGEASEELEVSEEFLDFLRMNARYKEDARLERERLRAKNERRNSIEELEAGPSEPRSDNTAELQELYGEHWKRIAATEMSVQAHFMSESDKCKPMYWPNIPFNFSYK